MTIEVCTDTFENDGSTTTECVLVDEPTDEPGLGPIEAPATVTTIEPAGDIWPVCVDGMTFVEGVCIQQTVPNCPDTEPCVPDVVYEYVETNAITNAETTAPATPSEAPALPATGTGEIVVMLAIASVCCAVGRALTNLARRNA